MNKIREKSKFLYLGFSLLLILFFINFISSQGWIKDSTGSSTVTIISNGTDTNETIRFNVLTGTDCGAGDFMVGVDNNGAVVCLTPTSVGDNSSWNHSAYWLNASATFLLITTYNNNYSTNHLAYLNTTNSTYDAYNATSLIRDWNVSGYIKNWTVDIVASNTSLYNWIIAQGYTANAVSLSTLLGFNYWNNTAYGGIGNWSADKNNYSTYANQTATFYLKSNPYGYFNTSNTYNCSINQYVQNLTLNSSGVYGSCVTISAGSEVDPYWTGNQSLYSNYSNNSNTFYLKSNPYGYYNSTNPSPETNWNGNWTNVVQLGSYNCSIGLVLMNVTINRTGIYGQCVSPPAINTSYVTYTNLSNSHVNTSDYWNSFNNVNSTQFESNNGALQIIESWLETTITKYWNYLWGTKDSDDLPEGTTNFYDNRSWNQSQYYSNATATFAVIGASEVDPYWTGNKSYYANYSNVTGLFLKISDWNSTNTSYYLITNPFGFYNISSGLGNWSADKNNYSTYANQTGLFLKISDWNSTNISYVTWAMVVNGTLPAGVGNWSADKSNYSNYSNNSNTFYLKSNPYAYINITSNIGNWSADKSNYSTYANQTSTFRKLTNNTFTEGVNISGPLNVSDNNIYISFNQKFCWVANCSVYTVYNETGKYDCYNPICSQYQLVNSSGVYIQG